MGKGSDYLWLWLDIVLGFNGAVLDIFLQSSKLLKPARLCVLQNCQDLLELFTLQLFMQTRQVPELLQPCSAVPLSRNYPQISKVQQFFNEVLALQEKTDLAERNKKHFLQKGSCRGHSRTRFHPTGHCFHPHWLSPTVHTALSCTLYFHMAWRFPLCLSGSTTGIPKLKAVRLCVAMMHHSSLPRTC